MIKYSDFLREVPRLSADRQEENAKLHGECINYFNLSGEWSIGVMEKIEPSEGLIKKFRLVRMFDLTF